MTVTYAFRVPAAEAARLGRLRNAGGLTVIADSGAVWVRAAEPGEELLRSLRSLPGTSFRLLDDGQLCEFDARVPDGYAPQGRWSDLSRWLDVEMPASALAGELRERSPLRLVPGRQFPRTKPVVDESGGMGRLWSRRTAGTARPLAFCGVCNSGRDCSRIAAAIVAGSAPRGAFGNRGAVWDALVTRGGRRSPGLSVCAFAGRSAAVDR